MIEDIGTHAMGPAGVAARMADIRAKFDKVFGPSPQNTPSFPQVIAGQLSNGLTGPIGPGGLNPLSPFENGAGVEMSAPGNLRSLIQQAASNHGLDPDLLDALVRQESGYSTTARSTSGALGLTQLMPSTAEALGVKNAFDPAQNLDAGARYLKQQLDRFGDLGTALAAYNAGPGAVVRHGGIPPYRETQAYVRNIIGYVEHAKATPHG
jgi:hypothetical protein